MLFLVVQVIIYLNFCMINTVFIDKNSRIKVMKNNVIGSILLGGALLVLQPVANAGQCMKVGVAGTEYCNVPVDRLVVVETGTLEFRDAISEAIGKAEGYRTLADCPSAHVSIVKTFLSCDDDDAPAPAG